MKTRAAVCYEAGKPLVIESLDLSEPKTGEVLVKMAAVGLCHSDYHVITGDRPVKKSPIVLGHEGAGVVKAVGPTVARIKPGDHVVCMFIPSCGKCFWCASGRAHACVLGASIAKGPQLDGTYRLYNHKGQSVGQFCMLGAFSEYAVVNQDSLCVVDKDFSLKVACLLGCGVVGGVGAAINRAQVKPGSSVLVIGVGGVGINVVQGAKLAGATTIIAVDQYAKKLEWAKSFGATHTIDSRASDVVGEVLDITDGKGVEYAFEAISSAETISQAFRATAKLGVVVVIGLTPASVESLPVSPLALVLGQKTILGTIYGSSNARVEIPRLLDLYKRQRIKLDELITKTYTLDQINQGYADMVAGKNIRGVLLFD